VGLRWGHNEGGGAGLGVRSGRRERWGAPPPLRRSGASAPSAPTSKCSKGSCELAAGGVGEGRREQGGGPPELGIHYTVYTPHDAKPQSQEMRVTMIWV
jgi:hypothetical protein